MAALRPASDWPSLTATIDLPAARAMRQAALNFASSRDRLDIDDDDLELRLVGEEGDVVGDREPGLVAAGDQIFRPDAALLQRLVGEDHHAAALADERDRARPHRQRTVLGQRDEAAPGADIAHAVRARHGEPGVRDHRGEFAAERGGLRIEAFAEAGGEHRGAARAGGGAALERLDHACRRHQHHHVVGRFGQRFEIRIAGLAPDLGAPRIDQIDRTGKLVVVEIVPYPRRPAAGSVAGADQNGVARRGERRDFVLGCFENSTDRSASAACGGMPESEQPGLGRDAWP